MSDSVANLYNSAVAAYCIAIAEDIRLLDALRRSGVVCLAEFCEQKSIDQQIALDVTRSLAWCGIVELDSLEGVVRPGPLCDEVWKTRGFFSWLCGGYGPMLSAAGRTLASRSRGGIDGRDADAVARAGSEYGRALVDPFVYDLLGAKTYRRVADLGCGFADRLYQILEKSHSTTGVAVDINPDILEAAKVECSNRSLSNRVEFIPADVAELKGRAVFEDVDLIMCFFMGHDLWPRERAVRALSGLTEAFPRAKRMLLADTFRSDGWDRSPPIFSLGFELTHSLMGTYVPKRGEWDTVLHEAGWRLEQEIALDIPFSSLFDLRR